MAVHRIALPIDPVDPAETLFAHGVALALHNYAELDLVHVHQPGAQGHFAAMPGLRELLVRWGRLSPEAPPQALESLRIRVVLDTVRGEDPAEAAGREVQSLHAGLLVVGTHRRKGLSALLTGSIAAGIARRADIATLFLGLGEPGFVDLQTGALGLRRVVVPVGQDLDDDRAVELCAEWLPVLGAGPFQIHLLRVGPPVELPPPAPPPGLEAEILRTSQNLGDLVAGVLAAAQELKADLVLMASHGHDSWLDAIAGSKTEQLVRWIPLPVLVVPIKG
jgi:nucleotide-binding universal stress UspA family protein